MSPHTSADTTKFVVRLSSAFHKAELVELLQGLQKIKNDFGVFGIHMADKYVVCECETSRLTEAITLTTDFVDNWSTGQSMDAYLGDQNPNYLVLSRSLISGMNEAWQNNLVRLLQELEHSQGWDQRADYLVKRRVNGQFIKDGMVVAVKAKVRPEPTVIVDDELMDKKALLYQNVSLSLLPQEHIVESILSHAACRVAPAPTVKYNKLTGEMKKTVDIDTSIWWETKYNFKHFISVANYEATLQAYKDGQGKHPMDYLLSPAKEWAVYDIQQTGQQLCIRVISLK